MPSLMTPQNFKCDRYCGECCKKALVPLQKEDISSIKKLGFSEGDFIMEDPHMKSRRLLRKHDNGWCIFLKKNNSGKYTCSIHKSRPFACRQYPFFTNDPIVSCLPDKLYPNVFFKVGKHKY